MPDRADTRSGLKPKLTEAPKHTFHIGTAESDR